MQQIPNSGLPHVPPMPPGSIPPQPSAYKTQPNVHRGSGAPPKPPTGGKPLNLPAINSPYTLGLVSLGLAAGMFFGIIPWRVAVSVGVFFGIFQGFNLWKGNPMSPGFKMRQLLVRVMVVLAGIVLMYIAGINAEPYRIIINEWDPPSFFERFSPTDWVLRNLAGYILWGTIQLGETLVLILCSNPDSMETLIADIKAKRGDRSAHKEGDDAGTKTIRSIHNTMNFPKVIGLTVLAIVAYIIDASILLNSYPPFESGVFRLQSLITFIGILVGFEVMVWVVRLLKGVDTDMRLQVIVRKEALQQRGVKS